MKFTSYDRTVETIEFSMNNEYAKILSMVILGVGSFLFGIIPAFFSQRNRRRHPFTITILLCFGAGVLLATSIVHMLAEVSEDLNGYAEIIFCMGFFIVYAVDELVHYFIRDTVPHNPTASNSQDGDNPIPSTSQYGTINVQTPSLFNGDNSTITSTETSRLSSLEQHIPHQHTNEYQHHHHSITGQIGLLAALTLHALIEGLAIGVQTTSAKVLLLVGAVCVHKFVVGFCLGVEICSIPHSSFRKHVLAIFLFSFGSVVGILCGMCLVDFENTGAVILVPILQGLAGGTLLYVTVAEVLPREKAKWHMKSTKPAAGLIQLFSVSVGFTIMSVLNFYFGS